MAHLDAFTYSLHCTKRGQIIFKNEIRQGYLVRYADENDHLAIGEFSPFPGVHVEKTADFFRLHKNLVKEIFSLESTWNFNDQAEAFKDLTYPLSFLLSMAHCQRLLKKDAPKTGALKLSALVENARIIDAVTIAKHHLAQGFLCLKIKVGSLAIDDEIKKIKTIAALAHSSVSFRIDANRSLNLKDATTLFRKLRRVNIEYCEEPLNDLGAITALYEETGIQCAVDESLFNLDEESPAIKFVVVKPSRFHTIYDALRFMRSAALKNLTPILSHCFETELTAALYALLAKKLGLQNFAHGIFAEGFFKTGIFSEPLRSFRGQLFFDACAHALRRDIRKEAINLLT